MPTLPSAFVENMKAMLGPEFDAFEKSLQQPDRKSTRLNSSHVRISYAVFCLKKKKKATTEEPPIHTHAKHHATSPALHTQDNLTCRIIPHRPALPTKVAIAHHWPHAPTSRVL